MSNETPLCPFMGGKPCMGEKCAVSVRGIEDGVIVVYCGAANPVDYESRLRVKTINKFYGQPVLFKGEEHE